MFALQQLALLAVSATPVLVVAVLNVYLYLKGERGTLLLPEVGDFPALEPEAGAPPAEAHMPEDAAPEKAEPLREAA
jgi:hypothetical protein